MRFWLHPTSLQRKLPNGWRVLNQTCLNSPSDLTQSRKSMDSLCQSGPIRANKCQSSISGTIEFNAKPRVDGQFNPDMLYSHHRFNKNFCKDGPHTLPSQSSKQVNLTKIRAAAYKCGSPAFLEFLFTSPERCSHGEPAAPL